MAKLVTAKKAARETVKASLKSQIDWCNKKIAMAMKEGRADTHLGFILYVETRQLLENAGYYIDDSGTHISWKKEVDAILENATQLAEVAKEAGITVIKPK